MRYFFGLGLGKLVDYSALAIVESIPVPGDVRPLLHVRELYRWDKGTDYQRIVADTAALMRPVSPGLRALVVDGTGVGDAVVEQFEHVRLDPIAVVLHGGKNTTHMGRRWHCPRESLLAVLVVALEQHTLRVLRGLPMAPSLLEELDAMPTRPLAPEPSQATDAYSAGRQLPNDDLVFAVALACWWAQKWAKACPPIDLRVLNGLRKPSTWHIGPTTDQRVRLPQRLYAEDVAGLGAASQIAAYDEAWEAQKASAYDQARQHYEAEKRARWPERREQRSVGEGGGGGSSVS
jgi:hypothetical protein